MKVTDDQFTEALIQSIVRNSDERPQNAIEAFAAWNLKPAWHGTKIFSDIAEILSIKPKDAHDIFYNRWSKQFFGDFKPYRKEIKEILVKTQQSNPNLTVHETVKVVQNAYPNFQFHYQTLYQFVSYEMKKDVKKEERQLKQTNVSSNTNIKEECNEPIKMEKSIMQSLNLTANNTMQSEELMDQLKKIINGTQLY
ncbi:Conserved_hypothetical protein [Hexamita inflata]|uniref:Uncharacterized protein n=1 Tax=Hexamita inflata TaxID=28002 RepID=A0ABP1HLM8_9EUKA